MVSIPAMRRVWFEPSYLLDTLQTNPTCAAERRNNLGLQPVNYRLRANFDGSFESRNLRVRRRSASGIRAAIIREKGVNGDREMAYSLFMAGFDVRDVHMTDLASGRETLEDINMIVFCGGFSNSDVLGSAKAGLPVSAGTSVLQKHCASSMPVPTPRVLVSATAASL